MWLWLWKRLKSVSSVIASSLSLVSFSHIEVLSTPHSHLAPYHIQTKLEVTDSSSILSWKENIVHGAFKMRFLTGKRKELVSSMEFCHCQRIFHDCSKKKSLHNPTVSKSLSHPLPRKSASERWDKGLFILSLFHLFPKVGLSHLHTPPQDVASRDPTNPKTLAISLFKIQKYFSQLQRGIT